MVRKTQGGTRGGKTDIRRLLSKGINFDHIFSPYQGKDNPSPVFGAKQFRETGKKLKAPEFRQAAQLGFTHVRISLGRAFLQESREPFNLRPEGLELLDRAIGLGTQNGLGVVLDMHQIPPADIFHDRGALDAFRKMWRELAAHYAGRLPGVVFELMNEPAVPELIRPEEAKKADVARWRSIMKDLVGAVQGGDPERYVIVGGAGWGEAPGLIQMGNLRVPHVIYTFHYYEPMVFTHQAATWSYKALAMVKDVPYPVPKEVVRKWRDAAKEKGFNEKPFREAARGFGKDDMRKSLQPVLRFAKKEGIPLYCGEFGVHKPFTPPESRARWISDFTALLEEAGVGWGLWVYRGNFGLLDAKDRPDPALVKALRF